MARPGSNVSNVEVVAAVVGSCGTLGALAWAMLGNPSLPSWLKRRRLPASPSRKSEKREIIEIKWKEIERFTDWGVLLLFGGGIVLSALLSETGASKFLADLVREHLSIHGPFLLILGSVMLVILLSEFASNTATAAIMVPIFLALGQETFPDSPKAIALSIGIAASCGFMLPVGTPPNALVFGTERIRQRSMIKAGFLVDLACGIVITIVSYFFFF